MKSVRESSKVPVTLKSPLRRDVTPWSLSRLGGMLCLIGVAVTVYPAAAGAGATQTPATSAERAAPAKTAGTAKPAQQRPGRIRLEKRIAALRDELAITAAQRKPWREVAAVMRSNEADMYTVVARRAGRIRAVAAPENLRLYGLVAAVHAANVQRLLAAFQPLYETLSDRQKKIADTILRDAREEPLSDGY